jgi:hypothetical protein
MYFGIRGKVALLVMLATAACALLVAKVLSHRATELLREHELVDLGDEASLKGWQIIDQVAGLQDDIISLDGNDFTDDIVEKSAVMRGDEDGAVIAFQIALKPALRFQVGLMRSS